MLEKIEKIKKNQLKIKENSENLCQKENGPEKSDMEIPEVKRIHKGATG